ncbi:hypothetical protein ABIB62_002346 [Mucilaginibacter sp. UYP25]|uniref:hypothetical protein n=1 Tax=unclassified Mucilaginibacter TaxID=2617802 RepID=UPI0033984F8E
METENPSFIFELDYAGKTVSCEVIMQENAFDVLFDGRLMASVEHTDDWTWIQASGIILAEAVIEEIGLRIESEYK